MKIILGLVGEIASGKGTVARYLEEKHNARTYRFSTPLRDILKRLHLEENRDNLQEVSRILREKFGQDLLAKIITEDVKQDAGEIIVVDGIRREQDIKYLRELPEFKLINIKVDIKTRYERVIERSENTDDKTKTFEEFLKEAQAEPELEIPKVAATADIVIDNSSDMENLIKQIDTVLVEFKQ